MIQNFESYSNGIVRRTLSDMHTGRSHAYIMLLLLLLLLLLVLVIHWFESLTQCYLRKQLTIGQLIGHRWRCRLPIVRDAEILVSTTR